MNAGLSVKVLLVAVVLGFSGMAQATNGYFAHGYSAAQNAMGGAGTALPEDALIAAINPAGQVWASDRLDFALSLFSPSRSYAAGPVGGDAAQSIVRINEGGVSSDNSLFFIPGFAYSRMIDEQSSWGVTFYGNGGMNTEYHGNSAHFGEGFAVGLGLGDGLINLQTQCEGTLGGGAPVNGARDTAGFCGNGDPNAGVNLMQAFLMPSYARKIGERASIGIGPIVAAQRFRADGLQAFAKFSNAPERVSDNGYEMSYGYGARVGFLTALIGSVTLGGSYQSKIKMSRFKKYEGLFAERGGFDIPQSWNVGVSLQPIARLHLVADFQRIYFGQTKSVGNAFDSNDFVINCARPRLLAGMGFGGSTDASPACLGADSGPGFAWRNVSVYKLGAQYRWSAIKLRAGYSHTRQPIAAADVLFNILAPGVVEDHYTLGGSYQYSPRISFDMAAMYAPSKTVSGKNPLSNTDATALQLVLGTADPTAFGEDANDQTIDLNMHQWQLTFAVSYHFN
ncbi:OmpP1/FadL family transporter [Sinimarinibacterium sp. NLF-5-8]|uniref:OmpP1/FadL family transporter n=1 Tax=Sinimarinibacterium sp. NLF-5-8 TaxID=2698684 RepID=UPI00137C334C|nr:outer membrane protein transport protein [Sinimarinibacterium sp. NLF-5-8]QHS08942.1 hypothetical protein GT972_01475 [Sinimarinibacterium sp. NLF-5-8]